MGLEVEGLKPFLARINRLPKQAQAEIREAAQAIADDEAKRLTAAGQANDKQSRAVAGFIKARKDRVPFVQAGQLFFGAEFGGGSNKQFTREVTETQYTTKTGKVRTRKTYSKATFSGSKNNTNQFRPHLGRVGYWFWPQLREDQDRMFKRWEAVVEAIAREWGTNG